MQYRLYTALSLFLVTALCACSAGGNTADTAGSDNTVLEESESADNNDASEEAADEGSDGNDDGWYEELDEASDEESVEGAGSSGTVLAAGKKKKSPEKKDAEKKDPSKGMTLVYPQIDISNLDNTAIPWGMGPSRDEFNRPVTALQYQDEYRDFNVDFIVPTEEKVIYLTFDEGYENGFTPSILDTLKRHNARGIFFVTYHFAESCPDLVRRMIDEGHIVGNHTIHHPSDGMQAHDIDYQTHEVTDMHTYIKDNFQYDMFLFRYPTGMFSRQSLGVVSNCGYRSVFWSFAYPDWDPDNQPAPSEALTKLETSLHPGAIYLLHAVSATNESIMDEFLTYVESQGYTIGDYTETLK